MEKIDSNKESSGKLRVCDYAKSKRKMTQAHAL